MIVTSTGLLRLSKDDVAAGSQTDRSCYSWTLLFAPMVQGFSLQRRDDEGSPGIVEGPEVSAAGVPLRHRRRRIPNDADLPAEREQVPALQSMFILISVQHALSILKTGAACGKGSAAGGFALRGVDHPVQIWGIPRNRACLRAGCRIVLRFCCKDTQDM